jgi:hypothetical protein
MWARPQTITLFRFFQNAIITDSILAANKYLLELVHYIRGDVKAHAQELSEQIKMRLDREFSEIPGDGLVQKAEVLLHKVSWSCRNI